MQRGEASRSLLAAKSIADLVEWSDGLYQPARQIQELVMNTMMTYCKKTTALARQVVHALLDEATLDAQTGPGRPARPWRAHGPELGADVPFGLRAAARHSRPWPRPVRHSTMTMRCASVSAPSAAKARRVMMAATGGVNTHRGAIWALGLLVTAAAQLQERGDASAPTAVAARAGALARHDGPQRAGRDRQQGRSWPAASISVGGARGQAQAGFPHVVEVALPALRAARARGDSEHHGAPECLAGH